MKNSPLTNFKPDTRRKLWSGFAIITFTLLLAGIMLPTPPASNLSDTPFFGMWSGFAAAFVILASLRLARWVIMWRSE